jgi:ribose transport system permease protein
MNVNKVSPTVITAVADGVSRRFSVKMKVPVLHRFGTLLACVLLVAVVTTLNPAFLSAINVFNMLSQWAPAGIMAVGMTLVVIIGGFDLSIASIYSLCAVVAALLGLHHSATFAFAGGALAGAIAGVCNAVLIVWLRINPYIATVGSGFVITGVSLVMTQNMAVFVSSDTFGILGAERLHGMPLSGLLFLSIATVAGVALKYTVFGHMAYAVGGNAEASKLSGIPVNPIRAGTYVILGACCGIAGFISASQLNSAQSTVDPGILFDVATIVVLGGNSFGGGAGSIWQTIVGLVMVASISNGFVMLDISPFYQSLFKGIIIVMALTFDSLLKGAASHQSQKSE